MDLVDNSEARFAEIREEYTRYMAGLGVTAEQYIPISARDGHNLVERSVATPWYAGPTLVETLDGFRPAQRQIDLPLRLPVQDIYKFDERRILVGRLECGRLAVGDQCLSSPGNQRPRVHRIQASHCPAPPPPRRACRSR